MRAPNRKEVDGSVERYQSLKLKESLSEPSRYALACKELSLILNNAFAKSPKNLQSLMFEDTLVAFSLLPSMRSMSAIIAADSLLQSTAVLPKQKRVFAVAEHKRAVVASKRKMKGNQDEQELSPLPKDVLIHIFSFLDLQSLVSASSVCRSWNAASNEKCLWKSLYTILTGRKPKGALYDLDNFAWKRACETAHQGNRGSRFKSRRGYCRRCRSFDWLQNRRCCDDSDTMIEPVSAKHIIKYILDATVPYDFSTDSDTDSDDGEDSPVFGLWAYPRRV